MHAVELLSTESLLMSAQQDACVVTELQPTKTLIYKISTYIFSQNASLTS